MVTAPYVEKPISEIEKQVPSLIFGGYIDQVVLPLFIRSNDDKTLLVGTSKLNHFKLPDTKFEAGKNGFVFDLSDRIARFGNFAFRNFTDDFEHEYLGLLRHKPEENTIIAPVIVDLPLHSTAEQYRTSNEWLEITNNPDQRWLGLEELDTVVDTNQDGVLTRNVSVLVAYYMEQHAIHFW